MAKDPKLVTRLKGLQVEEVSLVDRPANQHARVLLAKRDETGEEIEKAMGVCDKCGKALKMGTTCDCGGKAVKKSLPEALEKSLEVVKGVMLFGEQLALDQLYRITNALDGSLRSIVQEPTLSVEEKRSAAEKSLGQFFDTVKALIAAAMPSDITKTETPVKPTAEVLKSLPEAERAAIEKQIADGAAAQTALETLKKAEVERVAIEKAKSIVGKVNVKAEDLASVLKQLDEPGVAFVTDLLAKHNAVMEQKGLLKEVGSTTGEDVSEKTISSELEKAADALQKKDPTLTRPAAITKALEQNPELYEDEGQDDDEDDDE